MIEESYSWVAQIIHMQGVQVLLGERANGIHHVVDQRLEVAGFKVQLDFGRLDVGEIQDIVDQL